jgi:hypothetical protein
MWSFIMPFLETNWIYLKYKLSAHATSLSSNTISLNQIGEPRSHHHWPLQNMLPSMVHLHGLLNSFVVYFHLEKEESDHALLIASLCQIFLSLSLISCFTNQLHWNLSPPAPIHPPPCSPYRCLAPSLSLAALDLHGHCPFSELTPLPKTSRHGPPGESLRLTEQAFAILIFPTGLSWPVTGAYSASPLRADRPPPGLISRQCPPRVSINTLAQPRLISSSFSPCRVRRRSGQWAPSGAALGLAATMGVIAFPNQWYTVHHALLHISTASYQDHEKPTRSHHRELTTSIYWSNTFMRHWSPPLPDRLTVRLASLCHETISPLHPVNFTAATLPNRVRTILAHDLLELSVSIALASLLYRSNPSPLSLPIHHSLTRIPHLAPLSLSQTEGENQAEARPAARRRRGGCLALQLSSLSLSLSYYLSKDLMTQPS